MEDRWEHLDDEYAEETPFVKITKKPHWLDEGKKEKSKKIGKKGRRIAQRFKEFHQKPEGDSD